jgi:hypothetical protein
MARGATCRNSTVLVFGGKSVAAGTPPPVMALILESILVSFALLLRLINVNDGVSCGTITCYYCTLHTQATPDREASRTTAHIN